MKFSNAYAGVRKLFASELINIISSMFYFSLSLMIFSMGIKVTEIDSVLVFMLVIIFMGSAGITGIVSLILQLLGLRQARRDEPQFKTALIFAVAGIAASVIAFFTYGTFSNIFSGIDEVATLLVTIYTLLGIYVLAFRLDNRSVQKGCKITLLIVTVVFAFAVAARIISVFTPVLDDFLDIVSSALEFTAHIIFLIYLFKAKKMLA